MIRKAHRHILWHAGKAALCALQLWLLDATAKASVAVFLQFLLSEGIVLTAHTLPLLLIRPAVTVALFFALWHYYDGIDDDSFNRFCDAPYTLRDRGVLTEWLVTVLGATPILTVALYAPVACTALPAPAVWGIAAGASLLFTAVAAGLRLHALLARWNIQKDLRQKKEKTRILRRVLYAVVYFVALFLLISLGFSMILPTWGSVMFTLARVLFFPIAGTLLTAWLGFRGFQLIRGLISRRKFLRRLARLRDKGELSFEIHGHPYLSLLSARFFFGLTVVDAPHPDGRRQTDTTYRVAVASCGYRRMTVILCDRNIYRFMYALQFHQIVRFGQMGAASAGARVLSVPGAAFFTNHSFEFPEGEGERILLIDPTPYTLAIYGTREGELLEQDNGSHVFGYTVYGKNAFVNLLERI